MRDLDVSYNTLGCVGVELLLMCLKPETLTSLDLTATVAMSTANTICKHVAKYLVQVLNSKVYALNIYEKNAFHIYA